MVVQHIDAHEECRPPSGAGEEPDAVCSGGTG